MKSEKLRHKIDFLHKTTIKNEYGEPEDTWDIFISTWASKEPLLGNEYFNALTANTRVDAKFNCRYIPDITNNMRIRHGDEVYEILSAINVKSLNRELLCYCRLVE